MICEVAESLIDQVLSSDHLILDAPCGSFDECLERMGACLNHDVCSDVPAFLNQVRAREVLSSTIIQQGIAFPHARSEWIHQLTVVALRFQSPCKLHDDRPKVSLVFLMGVPVDSPGGYLECVAQLSRKLRDAKILQILSTCSQAEEFVQALAG